MSEPFSYPLIWIGSALAGFIDAIAGGGGLITVPLVMLQTGAGALAIGTNKIVGASAALLALLVYARAGHFEARKSLFFAAAIGVGSFGGSLLSPHLPPQAFRVFLILSVPLILWVVWRKNAWLAKAQASRFDPVTPSKSWLRLLLSGLGCGFYDGMWGPGGGTFMFLALIFFTELPLLPALTAAKFANSASALTALFSYQLSGNVRWEVGLPMAAAVSGGAWLGARFARDHTAQAIRPALACVALILAAKVIFFS